MSLPTLKSAKVLSDEEMLIFKGGKMSKCETGCRKSCLSGCSSSCKPGNANNVPVDATVKL